MKKIDIVRIVAPNKNSVFTKDQDYCLPLGNGQQLYFGSLKKAKAALAEINRYYNFKLMQVNELLSDVFVAYLSQWFIFYDKKTAANYLNMEKQIVSELKIAEQALDTCWRVSNYDSGAHYAVHHLRTALDALEKTCTALKELNRNKNLMIQFHRLETLRQNILWVGRSIEQYKGEKFEPDAEQKIDLFRMKIAD